MELGGTGFGLSLNYQSFISKKNNIHIRGGLGFTGPNPGRDGGSMVISIPTGLNKGVGKNKKLELGAGCTFFYFTNTGWTDPYAFISLGYYVDKNVRIIISPFIGNASTIKYYFNMNSPLFPYGGFNGTLGKRKIKR